MAHARNDGHPGLDHRVGQILVIEGPQILQGPTTPHHQHHVYAPHFLDGLQRLNQGWGRAHALNLGWGNHHRYVGHPALQGGDHIMQGRSTQGSHHTNGPGHGHQRALARFIKHAQERQFALELQEFFVPNALAGGLQGINHQLQVASPLIDRNFGPGLHHDPVVQVKVDQHGGAAKHGATQLRTLILEREIAMPTAGTGEVGDLALHFNRIEARRQGVGESTHQGGH